MARAIYLLRRKEGGGDDAGSPPSVLIPVCTFEREEDAAKAKGVVTVIRHYNSFEEYTSVEHEVVRQRALGKLTSEEREALGVQ